VLFFVHGNVEEVVVVCGREASGEEHGFGHCADGFLVEDIFEVLEGKGVLEDVEISDCSLTLLYWVGSDGGDEQQGSC